MSYSAKVPPVDAALDRATHRALVEAGYAPLRPYVERFEAVDAGGCAPPILAGPPVAA